MKLNVEWTRGNRVDLTSSLGYHLVRQFPRWLRVWQQSPSHIRSFVRGRRVDTTTGLDAPANRD